MTIAVTGATGQLGRLVIEALLANGAPADQIVAGGRRTERIQDLAERGVQVRQLDYDDPDSVGAALAGAQRLLLVSGTDAGRRVTQHRAVVEAAARAGVELLAYTSIANAGRTTIQLAADHQATERLLAESGVPHVLLRNSWYLENYTAQIPSYLAHGAVLGCAGQGRVSAATRADYAAAAAAVLLGQDQAGRVYELGGDESFTLAQLAAAVQEASGRPVAYQELSADELAAVLVTAGLPEAYAAALADADLGIARGDLEVTTGDLGRLLGRAPTTMPEAVRAGLARQGGH